ncbi:hypothetical protein BAE44_0007156 [Dichanthelium oligosanthes]|uniref:Glycosyltransferase 61 catalytic domain-containing protein n=1 Tax=Dichanthelium oligosanthes TaxID=888268 RepID=A0A1E5W3E3_9POAL|nr:hypothetical protein BAE44_0007156 [Dichanthelium oligosanthes]
MTSAAYSRLPKLPGGGGGERRLPPRLMRGLTSRIEPKKLGFGLIAGCCLALLTYVSLAKLFAIYSPVFASSANTSALMQSSPPSSSKPSVPETEAIPPQETLAGGGSNGNAVDPVDLPEAAGSEEPGLPEAATRMEMAAGSDEPGLPEAFRRENDDENEAAPSEAKPSATEGEQEHDGGGAAAGQGKMTCDENGADEGFPYARPTVCELSGDIRVSPKQKTIFLVNPSGAGSFFDDSGEKRLRPYARKDDSLLQGVVEVTVKSAPSAAAAPECTKRHRVPAVVFSIATDNFFHDMADAVIPLFLTTAHLKGEVQLLITNYKPWWVQKYTPLLRRLSSYDAINFDEDADDVHCFPEGFVGLYRDRDLILSPHPTRNPRNYTMVDFNRFARDALALPRDAPAVLGEEPGMRPRMLIISRAGTRRLLSVGEVAAAASELGFNVTVAEAGADVPAFAAQVNSADVLVAVHGAGLANQVFLPTKAVVVQIVPWGGKQVGWMATNLYGQPARDMKLQYLEYHVGEEETSLRVKYPREVEIVMKQDVSVNLDKFRRFLLQALDKLQG